MSERTTEKTLVIDLETKKQFFEVGGKAHTHLLGVSVAGAYDYATDTFQCFEEHELSKLGELIAASDAIVGFNIFEFDYRVLQPYLPQVNLSAAHTVDLLKEVERAAGFRVGLDNLASATLGEGKTANGLEAIQWFRQGKLDEVKKYCLDDVRLTRDLYEYGCLHRRVAFTERAAGIRWVDVEWSVLQGPRKDMLALLRDAHARKRLVEIDYVSATARPGEPSRKKRAIEIHAIQGDTVEAFCHLRGDKRDFKLWRIVGAEIKEDALSRPTLF
jgi:DEAD/DEAH box helicase domain-containing protein